MVNNIKFVIKIIIVLFLTVCILIGASALYKSGETYIGTYAGMEKFENIPEKIDCANFGPSYAMNCFRYEYADLAGKIGFNFGLTMQDLYHDYAIYKTYENNLSDGAVVTIPLSYFSFCSDTQSPTGTRYYKILPKKYIKDYTLEKYISAEYIPVYGNGNALVRDIVNDFVDSFVLNNVNASEEDLNESDKIKNLSADSKTRVFTIESGNLKPYQNQISVNEEILENWINEIKEKGFKPVIVLTPYWYEYANGFDEELLKKSYTDPVLRIVEKTGVDYLNFCGEEYEEYTHTPDYFNNCDHVSPKGSKVFMELFTDYLKENGLI